MNLHVRARSVEEAWAKEVQEVAAAAHLDRLRKSGPSGAARLASAASSSAFSAGILPSIAAHYVRLDTPQKVRVWPGLGRKRARSCLARRSAARASLRVERTNQKSTQPQLSVKSGLS